MRFHTTLVVLMFAVSVRLGATSIRGVILANELGGPPIANVQVSAVEGANPVSSRSNGTFVLVFPDKEPGETVQLIVQKTGMVVVNEFQLRLTLPKPAHAVPLTLLLCKTTQREAMASRFYRLKSFEAIERSYRKKLDELETKNQATEKAREQLRIERDQAMEVAKGAAGQLAKVKFGETSELYRRAISLFEEGKVDEALAVLDDEKLRRTAAAAREQKEAVENELRQVVESYTLKGQLLVSKFQFDEAEKAYKTAIAVAPDHAAPYFNFGQFSRMLNRFSDAEINYGQAYEIFRGAGDELNAAGTLNNLGVLYHDQHRVDSAQKAFESALAVFRDLAQKDKGRYLPNVAATLNNLGVLNGDRNRMEASRKAHDEALEIRRELVRQDPATYLPDLAMSLINQGILHHTQKRLDEAGKAYDEALGVYRTLTQQNPVAYLPDVALTLNNLGALHKDQHRLDEAQKAYDEALAIRRGLAQQNSATYLPFVADTLHNLGNLHSRQNQIEEARKAYEEALEIRRKLAQQNPIVYLPGVSNVLNNLGVLHYDQKQLDEAGKAYDEALGIRRKLAQQNPAIYLPDLGATLKNLGVLYRDQKRFKEAREALSEALRIYEAAARENPERYGADVESIRGLLNKLKGHSGHESEPRSGARLSGCSSLRTEGRAR